MAERHRETKKRAISKVFCDPLAQAGRWFDRGTRFQIEEYQDGFAARHAIASPATEHPVEKRHRLGSKTEHPASDVDRARVAKLLVEVDDDPREHEIKVRRVVLEVFEHWNDERRATGFKERRIDGIINVAE